MPQKVKLKRSIINKYLLGSTLPILFAILKEPFKKRIKGTDFFSEKMLKALTNRVNSITPQSVRQWGTMSPDQMLHHLNLASGSALGYFDLPDESYWMSRTISKCSVGGILKVNGISSPFGCSESRSINNHFDTVLDIQ